MSDSIKKRKRTLFAIVLIWVAFALVIGLREYSLKKRGILLNAKTLEFVSTSGVGVSLRYEFFYKGERIVGNNASGRYTGNREFLGKYFPVMYDPKMGMSELLVKPSNFKRYKMKFPDSLDWVRKFL